MVQESFFFASGTSSFVKPTSLIIGGLVWLFDFRRWFDLQLLVTLIRVVRLLLRDAIKMFASPQQQVFADNGE
jgi:hypothetical protein